MKPKPVPTLTPKQVKLFWSRVDRRGPTECWPWMGVSTTVKYWSGRYGIWFIRVNGRLRGLRPHRVAYTLSVGPIPENLTIDHVRQRGCTNPLCCNPAHLEPATMVEQIKRRDAGKAEVCKWGHPRKRGRDCRGCCRMNQAKRFLRNPEQFPTRQAWAIRELERHGLGVEPTRFQEALLS